MKLLVVNKFFANGDVVDKSSIPQIGSLIEQYHSECRVSDVLMWPSKETLVKFNADKFEIEAIIFC